MHSFVVISQPKSYNSRKLESYQRRLRDAFQAAYPDHKPLSYNLYGLVYHFYKSDIGIDADNISKPIWDSLRGIVFDDDKQIKMRIAGSFNSSIGMSTIDFTGLPGNTISTLLERIESEEHVLYVECGSFSMNLVRLNLERNGN